MKSMKFNRLRFEHFAILACCLSLLASAGCGSKDSGAPVDTSYTVYFDTDETVLSSSPVMKDKNNAAIDANFQFAYVCASHADLGNDVVIDLMPPNTSGKNTNIGNGWLQIGMNREAKKGDVITVKSVEALQFENNNGLFHYKDANGNENVSASGSISVSGYSLSKSGDTASIAADLTINNVKITMADGTEYAFSGATSITGTSSMSNNQSGSFSGSCGTGACDAIGAGEYKYGSASMTFGSNCNIAFKQPSTDGSLVTTAAMTYTVNGDYMTLSYTTDPVTKSASLQYQKASTPDQTSSCKMSGSNFIYNGKTWVKQ